MNSLGNAIYHMFLDHKGSLRVRLVMGKVEHENFVPHQMLKALLTTTSQPPIVIPDCIGPALPGTVGSRVQGLMVQAHVSPSALWTSVW